MRAKSTSVPNAPLAALADALVQSGGVGWDLRTIRLIADTSLRINYAADALLELMRSSKVPSETRVSLLESLARSPAHAAEAIKWRMGEMFDAPEVRDRLVELRKRRQT